MLSREHDPHAAVVDARPHHRDEEALEALAEPCARVLADLGWPVMDRVVEIVVDEQVIRWLGVLPL